MGTGSFLGGKERPGRDAGPSPPSSAVVKKEYSYTSTPVWAVRPVQSLSACTRVQWTAWMLTNSWTQSVGDVNVTSDSEFCHKHKELNKEHSPDWNSKSSVTKQILNLHLFAYSVRTSRDLLCLTFQVNDEQSVARPNWLKFRTSFVVRSPRIAGADRDHESRKVKCSGGKVCPSYGVTFRYVQGISW